MNKREKIIVLIAVLLVVVLLLKSFVFDPYKPQNANEEAYMDYVTSIIDAKYSGGIYGSFIVIRVVDISEMTDLDKKYRDENGDIQIADGKYKAKLRKYILGVLPYSDERILEGVTK